MADPLLVVLAVLGWWTHRAEPVVRALAGSALAWTALLAAMIQLGYPGTERFMVLPAAAVCVMAAGGAVAAARVVLARRPPPLRVALAAGLVAIAVFYLPPRVDILPRAVQTAESRARSQQQLRSLVRSDPQTCGTALLPRELDWNAGAVAWDRNEPLEQVGSSVTGERALNDESPHVDLIAGRFRTTYGLPLPPGEGGEVYVRSEHRPVAPRVPSTSGLRARLDGVRGRWSEVDVCRLAPRRRPATRRVTRGA
jgi:hypothetical protein